MRFLDPLFFLSFLVLGVLPGTARGIPRLPGDGGRLCRERPGLHKDVEGRGDHPARGEAGLSRFCIPGLLEDFLPGRDVPQLEQAGAVRLLRAEVR